MERDSDIPWWGPATSDAGQGAKPKLSEQAKSSSWASAEYTSGDQRISGNEDAQLVSRADSDNNIAWRTQAIVHLTEHEHSGQSSASVWASARDTGGDMRFADNGDAQWMSGTNSKNSFAWRRHTAQKRE